MRLKNSLSSYPVLNIYNDDYVGSSFTVRYDMSMEFKQLYCKVSFQLDNSEIQALIQNHQAKYFVHVECPSTSFRKTYSTSEDELEFRISSKDVNEKIEVCSLIVLKQDIHGFTSKSFHPDYGNAEFDLSAHQKLAIGNAYEYTIQNDDRDLESLPSIINIYKMTEKNKGSMLVNTDEDEYVLIGLSEESYDLYARLGKTTFKKTVMSLVLLPAMIIVLQRMVNNKEEDGYCSKHWFQVINTKLERNNHSLDTIDIDDDSLLRVCQMLFDDPISNGLKELDACSERM